MRVVVADDEALLREGLVRLLTEAGFEVIGTASTPPACSAWSRHACPTSR